MQLVKNSQTVLVTPLTYLINRSIVTGKFPSAWKTALVTPLLKKGEKTDKKNYRPVALLSSLSKVLEAVLHKQLSDHVEKHGLIPKNQHGFRKNRSTTSALVYLCSKWEALLQQGLNVGVLLFDLSAAFDCLDADVLDSKLGWMGFGTRTRSWIRSYLTNRQQQVRVGTAKSDTCHLTTGSPQGAILSPLLFILYISDFELWIDASSAGYADDTSVFTANRSIHSLIEALQLEALKVLEFMATNKLIANETKTEFVILRPNPLKYDMDRPEAVRVGDAMVKETPTVKLLGLFIDHDMKWNTQLQHLKKTMTNRIGLLRRLKSHLTPSQLKQVAHGVIYSKLRYALAVFGRPKLTESAPTSAPHHQLQVELNNLMRLVLNRSAKEHNGADKLSEDSGLPTLNQIVVESTCLEMWKSFRYQLPAAELISPNPSNRKLRANQRDFQPEIMKRSRPEWFIKKGTELWNSLPRAIKDETVFIKAKKLIKDHAKIYCYL